MINYSPAITRLLLPLLLLTRCAAPHSFSVETVETVKRSIVPIVCGYLDNANQFQVESTVGTGFFINRQGYFATAGHVVRECDQLPTTEKQYRPAIYLPAGRWLLFRGCAVNEQIDIAACHPATNPFIDPQLRGQIAPLRIATDANSPDGLAVAFTGFPFGFQLPITSVGHLSAYDPQRETFLVDKHSWGGFSGSPIYTGDSTVIAVLTDTARGPKEPAPAPGLAYGKASHVLAQFLRESNVLYNE